MKPYFLLITLLFAVPVSASTSFITSVIDGDTAWADYLGTKEKIRILGIDTPEKGECLYTEATEYVKSFFVETSEVVIINPNQKRDRYGRVLAHIILPDGRDIGELLLTEGYATYYRDDSYDKKEYYASLEQAARDAQIGLWDPETCAESEQEVATPNLLETILNHPFWKLFTDFVKQWYAALGIF